MRPILCEHSYQQLLFESLDGYDEDISVGDTVFLDAHYLSVSLQRSGEELVPTLFFTSARISVIEVRQDGDGSSVPQVITPAFEIPQDTAESLRRNPRRPQPFDMQLRAEITQEEIRLFEADPEKTVTPSSWWEWILGR